MSQIKGKRQNKVKGKYIWAEKSSEMGQKKDNHWMQCRRKCKETHQVPRPNGVQHFQQVSYQSCLIHHHHHHDQHHMMMTMIIMISII